MGSWPNVNNVWRLEEVDITFNIKAFRTLSEKEMQREVLAYLAKTRKGKRPKPGDALTILTVIGFRDPV